MWKSIRMLQPSPWWAQKLLLALALAGVATAAFCWGRHGSLSQVSAQAADPSPFPVNLNASPVNNGNGAPTEYSRRVVATLYDNIPVTREELGEFLIARFGAERLEFLVNRKIIEMECNSKGVYVTDQEIDAHLRNDLKAFGNITEKDFVAQVLKRFNKTLYEWREDVIRPKLLISKLVQPTITATDEDVRQAFEARYGPKVQCRMIVLAADDNRLFDKWKAVKDSNEAFIAEAKKQFIPALAAREGDVPAIHKHFGDVKLEQAAFNLKEGEISSLIDLKDGTHVILRCEKHLPADQSARYEDVRSRLLGEVKELKLANAVPEVFKMLHARAHPRIEPLTPANTLRLTTQATEIVPAGGPMPPPPMGSPLASSPMPAAPVMPPLSGAPTQGNLIAPVAPSGILPVGGTLPR